jgi:hypothetical protein
VATQSQVNVSYGPLGLGLLQGGYTAEQALKALTAGDPGAENRAAEPLAGLGRLLRIKRAYLMDSAADRLEEAGDKEASQRKRFEAFELAPDMDELRFWAGLSMAEAGDVDGGCRLIAEAVRKDKRWLETVHRLVAVDRLAVATAGAIEARLAATARPL